MSALFFILILLPVAYAHMELWEGRYVCEKWKDSPNTFSPELPQYRYRLSQYGDYIVRKQNPIPLDANTTLCNTLCDSNPRCVSTAVRNDGKCIFMTQCHLATRSPAYTYYFKTFDDYNLTFGLQCGFNNGTNYTGIRPSTTEDCWAMCEQEPECEYAEIDENLECVLQKECAFTDTERGRIGTILNSTCTDSPTGSPTNSPTLSPSETHTATPVTVKPSVSPTDNPTKSPSTLRPTDKPTINPSTAHPTNKPTSKHNPATESDELSIGAIVGISLAIVIIVILILIVIVKLRENELWCFEK